MEVFLSGFMGLIQGLTEFLPVSSSGHLAIFNYFFPEAGGSLDYTFLLHIATLLAIIVYFRADLKAMILSLLPQNKEMKKERMMFLYLVIATAITGPIALYLEPKLDAFSSNLLILGIAYIATTILLVAAEYFTGEKASREAEEIGGWQAAFVGLAQGAAVVPGLSRSGTTIAAGMAMGLSRAQAARFSFLLIIPIVLAGAIKDGANLLQGELVIPGFFASLVGFVVAAVSGYFAIVFMIDVVKKITLYWFAFYTALLAILLIVLHFI